MLTEPVTIARALAQVQAEGLNRLDAQMLVLHALGKAPHDRAWLLAHDTDWLPPGALAALQAAAARRAGGEPLAYITGCKEFFGLQLAVDPRVLVPRPDTETLVEWALGVLPGNAPARVADLGTGSGAIALALKATRGLLTVVAVDASRDALAVAACNAQRLGLDIECVHGDWLQHVTGQFDAVVSNPPYIAAADPHLQALRHEPALALTSGADGLDAVRTILTQVPHHLKPGGWLLLEHGYDQAGAVRALLVAAGLQAVQSRRDLAGIERCSGGHMPHG
ncbi:MAG: peptide chain release factor N(5)-glutamine methyltransferase [Burkholderiales bacterium]|nr:peptide chain release factor N(5)-glutamine methyltransferase [Burkholderiales bacterium]